MGTGVAQNVLWLDVSMADALCMDVGNRPHELIRVEFDYQIWNHLLHLEVLLHYSIGGIRNVVHHHIEVNLIGLFSISIEALPHFDTVGMMKHLQDRQLSVLIPLILKHLLDCHGFCCLGNGCLENHTK